MNEKEKNVQTKNEDVWDMLKELGVLERYGNNMCLSVFNHHITSKLIRNIERMFPGEYRISTVDDERVEFGICFFEPKEREGERQETTEEKPLDDQRKDKKIMVLHKPIAHQNTPKPLYRKIVNLVLRQMSTGEYSDIRPSGRKIDNSYRFPSKGRGDFLKSSTVKRYVHHAIRYLDERGVLFRGKPMLASNKFKECLVEFGVVEADETDTPPTEEKKKKKIKPHYLDGLPSVCREACVAILNKINRDGKINTLKEMSDEIWDEYVFEGWNSKTTLYQYLSAASTYMQKKSWICPQGNNVRVKGEKFSEGLAIFGIPDREAIDEWSKKHREECVRQLRKKG